MRRLKYVPIIHTGVEMGSMYGTLKDEYIRRFGTQKWEEHNSIIEDFWQGIRNKVFDLNLDYPNTRLYQDGLPVCGKEMDLVQELVKMGSRNHQILMELIQLGAKLEGTEDPKLLLEEYDYLKKASADLNKKQVERRYQRLAKSILQKRDVYIGQRIDKTLREGETGLLFIGITHRVNEKLPEDIEIDYLIYRLPFKEGFFPYGKES
jgi:RNase P subunit RPR2